MIYYFYSELGQAAGPTMSQLKKNKRKTKYSNLLYQW